MRHPEYIDVYIAIQRIMTKLVDKYNNDYKQIFNGIMPKLIKEEYPEEVPPVVIEQANWIVDDINKYILKRTPDKKPEVDAYAKAYNRLHVNVNIYNEHISYQPIKLLSFSDIHIKHYANGDTKLKYQITVHKKNAKQLLTIYVVCDNGYITDLYIKNE